VRKVKKVVLVSAMVLALLLMISPVMARMGGATRISLAGEYFGYVIDPGKQWVSEEGIVQVRDGVGTGTMTGDIPGFMTFTMNAAFDPTTGKGEIWGKFVSSDNFGNTFEGTFLAKVSDWGTIDGKSVGRGTGAYEGMHLKNGFWGYNAYFGLPLLPYPKGTPIYFYWEGSVLSPP
jgi:hypothetical protein